MIVAAVTNSTGTGLFDNPELFALTLSGLIAVVATLVVTFAVQWYLDQPKISGNLLQRITFNFGGDFQDKRGHQEFLVVLPYVYLTNLHKNPISLVDIRGEADWGKGKGWERLTPITDELDSDFWPNIEGNIRWEAEGRTLRFKNGSLSKSLLMFKLRPIEFGDYLHGFLAFTDRANRSGKDIKKFRVVCRDAFGKRHIITRRGGEDLPVYIFERDAGIVSEWK